MLILGCPVTDVLILRVSGGADRVCFTIEGPTPFPEMQAADPKSDYSPHLTLEVRRGYGEEWLALMGVPADKIRVIP